MYPLEHATKVSAFYILILLVPQFQTANKRNKLTFIAEPLDDGLAEKLENGKVNLDWDNRKVRRNANTTRHISTMIPFSQHVHIILLFAAGEVLPNEI